MKRWDSMAVRDVTADDIAGETLAFDPLDYGAKGDGISDDTRAVQAAINAAVGSGGGIVRFPSQRFRIAGPLRVSGFHFKGRNRLHIDGSPE